MKFTAKQLAQKSGVSEPAITKALNKGLLIRGKDKKFDSSNPRNKAWLSSHNVCFESVTIPEIKGLDNSNNHLVGENGELRTFEELTGLPARFESMTMKEIVYQYGDLKEIANIADTLNKIMTAVQREVKTNELRKKLIPRDFVQSNVFAYVDLMNTKLIKYFETSLKDEVKKIKANPECEKELLALRRKSIQQIISDSKKEILNGIKKLRVDIKDEDDE